MPVSDRYTVERKIEPDIEKSHTFTRILGIILYSHFFTVMSFFLLECNDIGVGKGVHSVSNACVCACSCANETI